MQTWVKQSTNLASLFESRRRACMTKSTTKKKKKEDMCSNPGSATY